MSAAPLLYVKLIDLLSLSLQAPSISMARVSPEPLDPMFRYASVFGTTEPSITTFPFVVRVASLLRLSR